MNINALVIGDERADVVVICQTLAITSAGSSHVEYTTSLAEGVERLTHGGIESDASLFPTLPPIREAAAAAIASIAASAACQQHRTCLGDG